MTIKSLIEGKEELKQRDIINGEDILLVNEKRLHWNNPIDDSIPNENIKAISLDNIKQFISAYNKAYKQMYETKREIIMFDEPMGRRILTKVTDKVKEHMKAGPKPVFITAIEVLLEEADRINLLQV